MTAARARLKINRERMRQIGALANQTEACLRYGFSSAAAKRALEAIELARKVVGR